MNRLYRQRCPTTLLSHRLSTHLFSSSSSSLSSASSTSPPDTTIHKEISVPIRRPSKCKKEVWKEYTIDTSRSGLVGAGAFAEVRQATPLLPASETAQAPQYIVKSFHYDTDVYFDSLNRELAALDMLTEVKEVQNYVCAYGESFFQDQEEEQEHSQESSELHIVSEFIPHGDLFDFIMNCPKGQVPVLEAVHIGKQLVSGLAQVHSKGWLHLDVKPENVCIQTLPRYQHDQKSVSTAASRLDLNLDLNVDQGRVLDDQTRLLSSTSSTNVSSNITSLYMGGPDIRLIDFGHARPFPLGPTNITGEAGSDSYASPEVLRMQQFSPTSDTWSFGILMYAMVRYVLYIFKLFYLVDFSLQLTNFHTNN